MKFFQIVTFLQIIKIQIQITKPDSKKRGFVVCFSRMFFFERWQAALTALQLYKFHGVDLMVIPIISVIKEIFDILREYENDGVVKLKRAAVIPTIVNFNEFKLKLKIFSQI